MKVWLLPFKNDGIILKLSGLSNNLIFKPCHKPTPSSYLFLGKKLKPIRKDRFIAFIKPCNIYTDFTK